MPGICGIISGSRNNQLPPVVNAMADTLRHAAHHVVKTHFAHDLGIYAAGVALQNSFAENPVLFNEDKSIALVLAGECFLDHDIGADLKTEDHRVTGCKAGWLPHYYEAHRGRFFEKLNGLFSGLLIDRREGKAYLFNDRYGIQRIYFHEHNGDFYFASEAKALLRVLPELRAFDQEGLAEYLTYGSPLDWKTLFRGVYLLPGGSAWTFENGACRRTAYFTPEQWESQPPLSADDFEQRFADTFKRILPRYFECDSPLGIALTGGLDTRMIMACRPQNGPKPVCYTFSGESRQTLDDKIAALVARASGLEHQLLRLDRQFFENFATHADETVYVTDGCSGISGAHEIYFNRQARRLAPTRLTGNYGSEVFRGVSTFKPIPVAPALFSRELRPRIDSATERLARKKGDPMTFAIFKEVAWNLFGTLAAGRSQVQFRTPYLDNELVALAYQSPPHLRKSSLPAARLVKDNCKTLSAIPTDRGYAGDNSGLMFLFRRFISELTFKLDYYNNEGLPDFLAPFDSVFQRVAGTIGVIGKHKFLHYRSWLRGRLAGYLREKCAARSVLDSELWDRDFVRHLAADHIRGRRNLSLEINAVLTLEAIERKLFRELPRQIEFHESIKQPAGRSRLATKSEALV
ncbi:MAG TPA: asparagine synthase-related protein [Verrucomicrobiae bacterium]|nr:asparagine synthase-related protein [Verrucomicrobiae bacterium]